ncbi:MAG: YbhN family protein [Coleofasciculaceae cyanobacterium]
MKKTWSSVKPYLRWLILGGTLFFLVKALKDNWQNVTAIQVESSAFLKLFLAFSITLIAHIWAGLVWGSILQSFRQPVQYRWVIPIYLKTNIAKYLPGNVWHYYGRILAVTKAGGSLEAATVSVLIEPLLMATAALLVALIASLLGLVNTKDIIDFRLQILSLCVVCLAVHPRVLNPALQLLSRFKGNPNSKFQLQYYPLLPLLGELLFLGLRGAGFLFTFSALTIVNTSYIPLLFSAFSIAWVLGLVIPTPGGLGVFETTAIALLSSYFPTGIILSVVAIFRLISILAEILGAGLGMLIERFSQSS